MTLALRATAGRELREAKAAVDQVLEGEVIDVPVHDAATARHLAQQLRDLGAEVEVRDGLPAPGTDA